MIKYLIIAGHGLRKDGSFDPGARGLISKGEHKYISEDLFPAMKRYAGKDFIFFSDYNVYSYGNIIALAGKYGITIKVIEIHYDAFNGNARGGHVIIHSDYSPDKMDLRIRDAIKNMVGLRFSHRGHKGISGRANLANVNRTRRAGVNYRMIELGFGDNKTDANILIKQVDDYAKKLVEAIQDKPGQLGKPAQPTQPAKLAQPAKPAVKSVYEVAKEVIAGKWGNGDERFSRLKDAGYIPTTIQAEVGRQLKPTPKPSLKSNDAIVKEVMAGKWGNNPKRESDLRKAGYNPKTIQDIINGKPTATPKPSLKSNATIAKEVMAGKWGNNPKRESDLRKAGYNPKAIQDIINGKPTATPKPSLKSNDTIVKEVMAGKWGNNPKRESDLRKAGYNPKAIQDIINKM